MAEENKPYDLNIMNRLILKGILPKENNFATMRLLKNLNEKLRLTEKEIKDCKIAPLPNGKINFGDPEAIKITKTIIIDIILVRIIVEEFKKLDREKKITDEMINLYEMFIQ